MNALERIKTVAKNIALVLRAPSNLHSVDSSRGWFPLIREPYTGAWQRNEEVTVGNVTTNATVFACTTLIMSDIAKCRPRVVQQDNDGIWTETSVPAFSPVLRKPNHFQNRIQFFENWVGSKLLHGNTYALKQRDDRRVVRAMYVLDPTRVRPLVAPNGDVYYSLDEDRLARLVPSDAESRKAVIVPATEIIHDRHNCLFHPLVGLAPIYACGLAAAQGLNIQANSNKFFSNGSNPSGVLTAPGTIKQETADRMKEYWESEFSGENVGRVAVLGDGLKYEPMTVKAVDAQLIEQLKWTSENVCTAYKVPAYMVGIGPPPNYNNIEALNSQYYIQCLQVLIESIELCLDEGLGLTEGAVASERYGVEFDLDDLLRMDTATLVATEKIAIDASIKSPNEARKKLGLKPVKGGESPMAQQQQYSLEALANRDADEPFSKPTPAAPGTPPNPDDDGNEDDDTEERFVAAVMRRSAEIAERNAHRAA